MFKKYESKPVTRLAHEIKGSDFIGGVVGAESTSELVLDGESTGVKFKHYEPVIVGDFIVYLNDSDVYHCSRKVFMDRNIIDEV
jgi:hypothetical protein